MTDAEYRRQKARIQRLIKKWAVPLGLRWWSVRYEYSREPLKSDAAEQGMSCVAQAKVNWEYLLATISFDMQCTADQSDDDLENTFVHECCHVLVNEMRMWADSKMPSEKHNEAMKHEERVVTQMANAFIWTMQAGLDEGKKSARKRKSKK